MPKTTIRIERLQEKRLGLGKPATRSEQHGQVVPNGCQLARVGFRSRLEPGQYVAKQSLRLGEATLVVQQQREVVHRPIDQ